MVHEAYVRLVGGNEVRDWDGRGHYFAAAAEAMRRILVDRARRKNTYKAGDDRCRVALDAVEPAVADPHPRKAEVVKLRFFAGLTTAQAAALRVSASTVENDWAYARNWLRLRMDGPDPVHDSSGRSPATRTASGTVRVVLGVGAAVPARRDVYDKSAIGRCRGRRKVRQSARHTP